MKKDSKDEIPLIDTDVNDSGWSGLMYSAYYQYDKAVDFFIFGGADVTKTNALGWNSLFLLAMNQDYKKVWEICIGCILHKDKKKFFWDNHYRMLRIASSLMESGIDYDHKDDVNNTVKVYCLRIKNEPLYEWFKLIENKKLSKIKR